MSNTQPIDAVAANKFFSVDCFGKAWELIEKVNRSEADDEQMLLLAYASLWHWTQRPDCVQRNKSIGYWQLSRIYALLGRADEARTHGRLSLDNSEEDEPFFMGYAYEALARAELIAGNCDESRNLLLTAWGYADRVTDAQDRQLLQADLQEIESRFG
jgi:hypothetical protein